MHVPFVCFPITVCRFRIVKKNSSESRFCQFHRLMNDCIENFLQIYYADKLFVYFTQLFLFPHVQCLFPFQHFSFCHIPERDEHSRHPFPCNRQSMRFNIDNICTLCPASKLSIIELSAFRNDFFNCNFFVSLDLEQV